MSTSNHQVWLHDNQEGTAASS